MFLAKSLVALIGIFATVSALIVSSSNPSVQEICSLLPPNTFILRPHNCTTWVRCPSHADSNDYEERTCQAGLYYDKDDGRCFFEDNVRCPYGGVSTRRCVGKRDGTILLDPLNCRGYVYCRMGTELPAQCPSGMAFDRKLLNCVRSSEVECPKGDRYPNVSPVCRSIAKHQFFAHEDDCTQYYECTEDGLVTRDCVQGMAFNYLLGRCVPKGNVVCRPKSQKPLPNSNICGVDGSPRIGFVRDPQSCSGYYVCAKQTGNKADRHPRRMQCERGLFFDEAKWACRDRFNVPCPLDRCEGMGNQFVNVAGDCTAYSRCNNGVTIATTHCELHSFFDEQTQRCTSQQINSLACA